MIQTPQVMISEEEIRQKVALLADQLTSEMTDDWVIIALLRGSFVFLADLIRQLHKKNIHPTVEFMTASSYQDGTTSQKLDISDQLRTDVGGKNVLLLDDIFDTGKTLTATREILLQKNAKQVRTMALIEKPDRHKTDLKLDYVGFIIEDKFIVGYGLDHANKFRSLPYIGIID